MGWTEAIAVADEVDSEWSAVRAVADQLTAESAANKV